MTIAASCISEAAIAAQPNAQSSKKPPRLRQTIAKADVIAQPEAR